MARDQRRGKVEEKKPRLQVTTDGQLTSEQMAKFPFHLPRIVIWALPDAEIIIQSHGWFRVLSRGKERGQRAADWLKENFGKEVREGEVFCGLVVRQMSFGSFLRLTADGWEGLLHRSFYPEEPFAIGDTVNVQVTEVDRMGRTKLKAV